MRARHPRHLPRIWLTTDERMDDGLWTALERLPRGAGVVFRHYATPALKRRALYRQVRKIASKRGLTLLVAGAPMPGTDGVHGGRRLRKPGLLTMPVHSQQELVAARRAGADLIFVSPVFATRSHPGARTLGPVRLGLMLRGNGIAAVALGGLDARKFRQLAHLKLHGWAAIDAWTA